MFNLQKAVEGATFKPSNPSQMNGVIAQGTARELFKSLNVTKYGAWFNTASSEGRKMMTVTTKTGNTFSILSAKSHKVEAGSNIDLDTPIIQRENGSFFTAPGSAMETLFEG